MKTTALPLEGFGIHLEQAGVIVLRYGLALILLSIGGWKFTMYEAKGIEPLVMNSPFLAWAYHGFGIFGVARLLGIVEIIVGLLVLLRAISARLSALGSIAAALMFLITLKPSILHSRCHCSGLLLSRALCQCRTVRHQGSRSAWRRDLDRWRGAPCIPSRTNCHG